MRCERCGAELTPGTRFCLNCAHLTPPEEPAQPHATGRLAVVLTFEDGSSVSIDRDAVLGRNPAAAAHAEGLIGVPVPDAMKSVSRVHLRMHLSPEGVSLVDAGSGNGTRVEHAGTTYQAEKDEPFWLRPGDKIWLGDIPVLVDAGQ